VPQNIIGYYTIQDMRTFSIVILVFIGQQTIAQTTMRKANELIDFSDSSWPGIKEMTNTAKNKVEILTAEEQGAGIALYKTQVSTRSALGAVIYMTGGILIDNGWIRILGAGNQKLKRTLPDWNLGKTYHDFGHQPSYLIVADDAIGGYFALNGGGLGKDLGKIYYFAPDTLAFEPLSITYTEFLNFCFNGNLEEFYKGYRWKNWKNDVSTLNADSVFSCYPYLWSKEGKDTENLSRKEVPAEEQYKLNLEFKNQLEVGK